jgi:hypothetical protein
MTTTPSGLVNGRVGILSFWLKVQGGNFTQRKIFASASGNNYIQLTNTNRLQIQWVDAAGVEVYFFQSSSGDFLSGGDWRHILASWDLNGSVENIFIDDFPAMPVSFVPGTDIDYIHGNGAGTAYYWYGHRLYSW